MLLPTLSKKEDIVIGKYRHSGTREWCRQEPACYRAPLSPSVQD